MVIESGIQLPGKGKGGKRVGKEKEETGRGDEGRERRKKLQY